MAYYYKRRGANKTTGSRRKGGYAAKRKTKSKFTSSQKSAYHSGRGYAVAHANKGINFKNPTTREAFRAGYNAGKRAIAKNPKKYTDLKK